MKTVLRKVIIFLSSCPPIILENIFGKVPMPKYLNVEKKGNKNINAYTSALAFSCSNKKGFKPIGTASKLESKVCQ